MCKSTTLKISMGMGFFFGIITFVAGILMGLQEPLWVQATIWIGACCIMSSWVLGGLELGAMPYAVIFFFGTIGIIIGDISYMVQTNVEAWNTITGWFSLSTDMFTVKQWPS